MCVHVYMHIYTHTFRKDTILYNDNSSQKDFSDYRSILYFLVIDWLFLILKLLKVWCEQKSKKPSKSLSAIVQGEKPIRCSRYESGL